MFLTVGYEDLVEGVREALRKKNIFTEPTIEEAKIRLVMQRGKRMAGEVYIGEDPPDEKGQAEPDERRHEGASEAMAPVAPRKATA